MLPTAGRTSREPIRRRREACLVAQKRDHSIDAEGSEAAYRGQQQRDVVVPPGRPLRDDDRRTTISQVHNSLTISGPPRLQKSGRANTKKMSHGTKSPTNVPIMMISRFKGACSTFASASNG
jgi:hypothetical protein